MEHQEYLGEDGGKEEGRERRTARMHRKEARGNEKEGTRGKRMGGREMERGSMERKPGGGGEKNGEDGGVAEGRGGDERKQLDCLNEEL